MENASSTTNSCATRIETGHFQLVAGTKCKSQDRSSLVHLFSELKFLVNHERVFGIVQVERARDW
jgi:hypothetical protein